MLMRGDWIEACSFRNRDDAEVFSAIASALQTKRLRLILDLDSTLFDVKDRWLEVLRQLEKAHPGTHLARAAELADRSHLGYSMLDFLRNRNIDVSSADVQAEIRVMKPIWRQLFFSNDILVHDLPMPGAVEFVRGAFEAGAEIAYLTGRATHLQHDGSWKALERCGFPVGSGVQLVTNSQTDRDDLEHKRIAIGELTAGVDLAVSFENEPANIVAMQAAAPHAMHVFFESECSDTPAMPSRDLYRVKGFQSLRPEASPPKSL